MVRKFSNARHVMNMVIMHLNSLREKINIKKDSYQEDLEIAYMLLKRNKRMNLIRVEDKMN